MIVNLYIANIAKHFYWHDSTQQKCCSYGAVRGNHLEGWAERELAPGLPRPLHAQRRGERRACLHMCQL